LAGTGGADAKYDLGDIERVMIMVIMVGFAYNTDIVVGVPYGSYGRLMHIVGYADLGTKIFYDKYRHSGLIVLRECHLPR
jgi:hypothetical protein